MPDFSSLLKKYWPFLLIIIISGFFRVYRVMNPLNYRGSPFPIGYNGVDEGIHLMTARLANHGSRMYVDVNAQQGPLFMFIFQLLGGDPFSVRVLSVIMSLIGILAVIVIAERMAGKGVAILASLFLAVNVIFLKESRHASVDLYASVLLIIAFLFLIVYYKQHDQIRTEGNNKNWPMHFHLVMSGVFFALALQTKLFAVIPFACVGMYMTVQWIISWRKGEENSNDRLKAILIFGVSALMVAIAIMFIYGFGETFQGIVLDNLHRPGMPLKEKLTVLSRFLFYTSIPIVFSIIAVIRRYRERNVHLLLLWSCPLILLFTIQGLTWVHYFVLVVPPVSILGGYGVVSLILPRPKKEVDSPKKKKSQSNNSKSPFHPSPRDITILSLAVLFVVFFTCFNGVLLYDADRPIEYDVADDVAALSEEGEYVICGDPIISIYADRDQPPEATNVAAVRYPALDSEDLIDITCEYDVQVVVFTFHLSSYDDYLNFIQRYFMFHRAFDRSGETQWAGDDLPTDQTFFVVFYLPDGIDLDACRAEFLSGR
jgi:Ca2+/Na+ antiporter